MNKNTIRKIVWKHKQRWFKGGAAKYIGLAKTHGQHIIEAIAYNLKRTPNLLKQVEISKNQLQIAG